MWMGVRRLAPFFIAMKVTELQVDLFLPPPKVPRSDGVHLSAIIRGLAVEAGILKTSYAEELSLVDVREITDPVAVLRISIGLAWEQYYIPEILGPTMGVDDHPGEMCVDGIYMTKDGESVDVLVVDTRPDCVQIVHEVKATYKSTKTVGDLRDQWMWLAQMKGYCKGTGTRIAILHCLFLCGDYSYPIRPCLKAWQVEFTEQEIEENWQLMLDYKLAHEVRDE